MKKIYFLIIAALLLFIPDDVHAADSTLTCDFPWEKIPLITHTIVKNGNPVSVKLGFSAPFGGVGAMFELINNNSPQPVNILEARSGAGAGWQTTQFVEGYNNDGAIINQADGNAYTIQWGYSNALKLTEQNGKSLLTSDNWAPNATDTLSGKASSPCKGDSATFDEGQPKVEVGLTPVTSGSVIDITSSYSLRSLVDQYWKYYIPVQAFYLNRNIAKQSDLRVYLIGNEDWIEGPIRPYDVFTISHAFRTGTDLWPKDEVYLYQIQEIRYALFVWNINGQDIGILIRNSGRGPTLRLSKRVYCTDMNNYDCGSIDFIFSSDPLQENATFQQGSVRTHTYHYSVGTVPQLEELANQRLIPLPGDLNNSGHVDIYDYNILVSSFGHPYTIFDYNDLVANFGK